MADKKTNASRKSETLLVELLTEELPPKSLHRLVEAFGQYLYDFLSDASFLTSTDYRLYATPRRLAAVFPAVRRVQEDRESFRRGPSVSVGLDANGKPTNALLGFARSIGITIDQVERVTEGKTEYFCRRIHVKGEPLEAKLAEIVGLALEKLPIPKTMRWGDGDAQFVRPVHGLVMLHGSRIVPGEVLGLNSGNQTLGHRFLSSGRITIRNADSYEQSLLKTGKVIADYATRRTEIINKINEICSFSIVPVASDALYDEIAALVEAPAVYEGAFGAEFLEVPEECLILSMQQHQKYVPLRDKTSGKLLPRFLFVSNIAAGNPREIVHGNERVLRARLADAKFFYDQDRKTRLEARVPRLASVVYHNKLGSQLERVERIKKLSGAVARELKADAAAAERAAFLCKADLLTDMVGEFPELQGTMGRYYALHDGEPKVVADAIEQHYRPRYAKDRLPMGRVACSAALADKLESLNSMFSIGGAPTGEKDPFGLRRAALGALNILIEAKLPLELSAYVKGGVYEFMMERLRYLLRDRGYAPDEIEAVVSQSPSRIDLVLARLDAVRTFRKMPQAGNLAEANKRIRNILRKSEAADGQLNEALLQEKEERDLFKFMQDVDPKITLFVQQGDYTASLAVTATVQPSVTAFFDKVLVNADDAGLRTNRHALLRRLESLMNQVADISKLAK